MSWDSNKVCVVVFIPTLVQKMNHVQDLLLHFVLGEDVGL